LPNTWSKDGVKKVGADDIALFFAEYEETRVTQSSDPLKTEPETVTVLKKGCKVCM
jgi:hypothetical protein